jgi:hypothetical protein
LPGVLVVQFAVRVGVQHQQSLVHRIGVRWQLGDSDPA